MSQLNRRGFLATSAAGTAALGLGPIPRLSPAGCSAARFEAGEGTVDTTPPLGIELAGFHRPPNDLRKITGIRQQTAVRALAVRAGETTFVILSMDIIGFSLEMTTRIKADIQRRYRIAPDHVRLCATHTHSMPTFVYLRQWGAVPEDYQKTVEAKAVEAVKLALDDLTDAALYVGKSASEGANFNRTIPTWKTDRDFTAESTDDERWLDTFLHVLRFERAGGKPDLLWYHFSAHTVCYTDTLAGPDWPGLVDEMVRRDYKVTPSFLQGHFGDVNPGDGTPWIGDPHKTSTNVYKAFQAAMESAMRVTPDVVRLQSKNAPMPLDLDLLRSWMEQYRTAPEQCTAGAWVDAGFAQDWYAGARKWDMQRTTFPCPISVIQLGELGLLFHPTELFSYYGLALRHHSPLAHTVSVGYADGSIGYLTDPAAYKNGEYAAVVVPKILDLPPFKPDAARVLREVLSDLLKQTAT
jgi:neutral ceramidase